MKKSFALGLTTLFLVAMAGPAAAQDYEYHPELSDRFSAALGWMRSNNSFKAEAEGLDLPDNGTYVDFEDSLGVDGHSSLLNAQLRFKFGSEKKWSVFGQYFSNKASGEAVLTEDVEWDGDIFKKGSLVGAGVKMDIWRLFFGRNIFASDRYEFGVGAGLHNLDISLYIEGNVATNEDDFEYRRDEVGDDQFLPNIGAWYNFSPARRWLLHARVDWISADIGDYDGTLWNVTAGVNYQAWRHLGFDLCWQYFNLNGGAEKDDWRGSLDLTYSGPVIAMTFNW